MNTITVKDHVLLSDDSRVINIEVGISGAFVTLDNLHRPGWDLHTAAVPWGQMADVEFLYDQFNEEAVRTFKRLCEMLAQINSNKHIYEALA